MGPKGTAAVMLPGELQTQAQGSADMLKAEAQYVQNTAQVLLLLTMLTWLPHHYKRFPACK